MICKLSDDIWFGDKPSISESMGEVKSIINVAHSIRRPYWQNVSRLDYDVWYFKLALPDASIPDSSYLNALSLIANAIDRAYKYPLLCHCRMGGHRGPTAALFIYWHLRGRKKEAFEFAYNRIVGFRHSYSRDSNRRMYRKVIVDYCKEFSVSSGNDYFIDASLQKVEED